MKNNIDSKMRANFLLYLIAFVLFSCKEDTVDEIEDQMEVPVSTPLLTIKSTENLEKDSRENWIIISDRNGQVMSFGELIKDSTFTTNDSIAGNVNITLLEAYADRYRLQTYTDIAVGQTWFIPNKSTVKFDGENFSDTIRITNTSLDGRNNFYLHSASNAYGSVVTSGLLRGDPVEALELHISLHERAPKDILVILNDGIIDPAYQWFDANLLAENRVSTDFQSEFISMDRILEFSFNNTESIYTDITAYEENSLSSYRGLDGYIQAEFLHSEAESSYQYKVGFLDGFDFYHTRWSGKISGRSYSYTKFGTPPQVFSEGLFDSDFEITNSTFGSFQFTATGDFEVASGIWASEDKKTSWSIYYPIINTDNQVLDDFPIEIKEKYPDLTPSNLSLRGARFTDMIGTEQYADFIDSLHKNEYGKKATEQYSLYKSAE